MRKLGEELRVARERRELSLDDVYSITKIDVKFLQALEEDDFAVLPEPYIKAFIRSYAEAVGTNVSNLMRIYEEIKSSSEEELEPEDAPAVETASFTSDISESLRDIWNEQKTLILSAAGVVVILAVVLIGYLLISRPSHTVPQEEVQQAETIPVESGFKFSVRAEEPLYLMVSIDGGDSLDYDLAVESKREFLAEDSLWILTSNAGATSLSLGGESLSNAADEGVTAHFMVYETGIDKIKTYETLIVNE